MAAFGYRFGGGGVRRAVIAVVPPGPALSSYASLATFGDSITVGLNASPQNSAGWSALVKGAVGATTLVNAGVSGTVLQDSADSGGGARANNGRDRFMAAVLGGKRQAAIFLAYGFNDARYTGAPSTFNVASYADDYRELLNGLIIGGYAPADIHVGTPYYITDAGLASGSTGFTGQSRAGFEAYVQATLDVATEYGTKACNLYAWLRDNGYATMVDTDNIHPTNAGHALIAQGWQTRTFIANTRARPTSVTAAASGTTITVTAAAVPGAQGYDYALMLNPATVATGSSGSFIGIAAGSYHAKARAVFADGGKGPWAFAPAAVAIAAGGGTTLGQTDSYAGIADATLLTATTPTQGNWARTGWSSSGHNAAIGSGAIRTGTTLNATSLYVLVTAALDSGVFAEGGLVNRGSFTATQMAIGVAVRISDGTASYLAVFYNGTNIRLFKSINGTLTQIGASHTGTLTVGQTYLLRLEAQAGAQRVYLDGTLIISGSEAEANLGALGTGLGIRAQTASTTSPAVGNANGPALASVRVGTLS